MNNAAILLSLGVVHMCVPAYWFRVIIALEMKKENVDGPFPTSIVLNSPSIAPLLGHPTPTTMRRVQRAANKPLTKTTAIGVNKPTH